MARPNHSLWWNTINRRMGANFCRCYPIGIEEKRLIVYKM